MIDSTNEQYDKWLPVWTKCRDAIAGEESVHAKGPVYLPMLSGQEPNRYEAYKMRALYFNASGRTKDGMTGLIFRKKPMLTFPASLQNIVDDVDMCGSDLTSFAEQLVDELIEVSRVGILIDYPQVQSIGLTVGEAQSLGLRPYATIYKAESIIDWRYARINNAQMLTMVKLLEVDEVQTDEFTFEKISRIRVLDLFEGVYRVRVYQQSEKSKYTLISESIPLMNNAPIREIPFIFDSVNGLDSDVSKPVLLDLVNVNLSHYRSTADYEHGLHFTGLPTAVFWGAQLDEGETINIGSESALSFNNPAGHAEYLEFTGQGLEALRLALNDKRDMMGALGSKMLSADKKAAEAAETAAIHRSSENSILASISHSASAALTKMLEWLAVWGRVSTEVSCKMNDDFLPAEMSPQMFQQLTNAYLSGSISYETYFYNLQQGEVIASDTQLDDERERIDNLAPTLSE